MKAGQLLWSACGLIAAAVVLVAYAAQGTTNRYASAQDAETLVMRVSAALEHAPQQALQEINQRSPKWIHGDLYPEVVTLDGRCLAHGQDPQCAGRNWRQQRDAHGLAFVDQRLQLASERRQFWQEHQARDPLSGQALPKASYCQRGSGLLVCAGIYKR